MKELSLEEVQKHNSESDCWVVIRETVYDLTAFLKDHPGGKRAILMYAGKDATDEFELIHNSSVLTKYGRPFVIGTLLSISRL